MRRKAGLCPAAAAHHSSRRRRGVPGDHGSKHGVQLRPALAGELRRLPRYVVEGDMDVKLYARPRGFLTRLSDSTVGGTRRGRAVFPAGRAAEGAIPDFYAAGDAAAGRAAGAAGRAAEFRAKGLN